MSQATKQTGRRTPQTKPKPPTKDLGDGSMVVSINMLDKSVAEEFVEASKVIVASPKDKESKVTKSPGEKSAGGSKEEVKPSGEVQNGAAEKKPTNGVTAEKKTEEVTNGEGKVRESPRQKAKEAEKKAEEKKTEEKKGEETPVETAKKEEPEKPKVEKKAELNASTASTTSLAKEKELKGYKDNGDELPSIVLQPDESSGVLFDSPRPNKTPGKGLKGPNRARISPFRKSERLQNVSTAVNLSTVSEQSNEVVPSPPVDQSFGSLRHIGGRRSMSNRPLREFTFQTHHRESYRKLPDTYDDSMASVNATVGSDIHNDSFRTPIVASVKGRKRELTDSDDDIRIVDKTPASSKRARLDLSALLGFMASPVTLLRNKFQRANIQSSTPNQSFVVEELDKDTAEELDSNCSKDKSFEVAEELKEDLKVAAEGTSDEMELLKEKVVDVEMKTAAPGRRVCIIM